MMEAALIHDQQVSGTSIAEFERILKHNKTAISEIEPQGVETYTNARPQTIAIFVIPPNFEAWINRMTKRSTMTDVELRNRLESAVWEFGQALSKSYYHIVVNDDVARAVAEVNSISMFETTPERNKEKLATLQRLIQKTQNQLQSTHFKERLSLDNK